MLRLYTLLLALCMLILGCAACDRGPSPEELAATAVVETSAAAQAQTETAIAMVTDTPTPTTTSTATVTPTATLTPTPTRTLRPTNTPTVTLTPGPFSFFDSFASRSDGWEFCEACMWRDGTLIMGPYDPSSYFHVNRCWGCGAYTFYRVAVDVTFIDGEVDRTFGLVFGENEDAAYYMGISPWGGYIVERYDFSTSYWTTLAGQWSGSVVGGNGTNHIEVIVQPGANGNTAEYWIYLNGDLLYTVYNRPVTETMVGLAMAYHAQVVAYDNWEFVVIEP